jgi:hypothetical protein
MEKIQTEIKSWEKSNIQIFWGEIAPCDHLVQIYENDAVFMNTLEGFTGDGFIKGESVIVIATQKHLDFLKQRLNSQGFNIDDLISTDQYIPVNAEECIEHFMVNNWPDEELFNQFASSLIKRGQKNDRKVRAFGEMVAVLWAKGHSGATVKLENLWHKLHHTNPFSLYCAYPKSGFTQDARASIAKICKTHSMVIDGNARPSTEIYYKSLGLAG